VVRLLAPVLCGGLLLSASACTRSDGRTAEASHTSGDVVAGEQMFRTVCATCHGFAGEGLPGLGKPLRGNAAVAEMSRNDLVEVLKVGIPADDPLNTTGKEMPPRGGQAGLSDADLRNIAAFVRTLNP